MYSSWGKHVRGGLPPPPSVAPLVPRRLRAVPPLPLGGSAAPLRDDMNLSDRPDGFTHTARGLKTRTRN